MVSRLQISRAAIGFEDSTERDPNHRFGSRELVPFTPAPGRPIRMRMTDDGQPLQRTCRICACALSGSSTFCPQCGTAVGATSDVDPILIELRALLGNEI